MVTGFAILLTVVGIMQWNERNGKDTAIIIIAATWAIYFAAAYFGCEVL